MPTPNHPNVLFVTAEDISPNLGCYGDSNATSPNLDLFAAQGTRYTNVFSVHPCCSPSRSCLATGVYPTRLGSFQHRAKMWADRDEVRTLPSLLRERGYYTFNGMKGGSYKTDYNFEPEDNPWDSTDSKEIEWRNRKEGQPFFGQVNLFRTHQSQYGRRKVGEADANRAHDPAKIVLPDYHPDTPAIREIWAEYHDRITEMDANFGTILQMLEDDGLADETIVIFLGDNGMGIPAGKIWLWDQGLHVPMMVRVPARWQERTLGVADRVESVMVSFVDFAPTMLALCDVPIPDPMQGQVFLGPQAKTRNTCFAARDFHDGSDFDTSRAVRSRSFHYIRNFMPHQGWDPILYSWSRAPYMLTEWLEVAQTGALDDDLRQCAFFATEKPVEELYDIANDPDCTVNVASQPQHQTTLHEMRALCQNWMIENGDLGLLSQYELYTRAEKVGTPHRLALDKIDNPVAELLRAANLANYPNHNNLDDLIKLLSHPDCAVRRWGAIGLLASESGAENVRAALTKALADDSPDVRLTAAEALCNLGDTNQALETLREMLTFPDAIIRREVIYVLVRIGETARPLLPALKEALTPCAHLDIWSDNNVEEACVLMRACLGEPVGGDAMVPYALTRRRNRVISAG